MNAIIRMLKYISWELPQHEEGNKYPTLKKVLFSTKDFIIKGRLMMINSAKTMAGGSFQAHYHEDMVEIFIFTRVIGKVFIRIGDNRLYLCPDTLLVFPKDTVHALDVETGFLRKIYLNLFGIPAVEYYVFGISEEAKGKTIVVDTLAF